MANYYRTQSGTLLDAYWTDDDGTPVGTLTSFNYTSSDVLYLSEYNSTQAYDVTITSDPYSVLGQMGLFTTASTGQVTISCDVGPDSQINFQCYVVIDGGTADMPLDVHCSVDNYLNIGTTATILVPTTTHCNLTIATASITGSSNECINNTGHILDLQVTGILCTTGTYGLLNNNGIIDIMGYPGSSTGTNEFGNNLTMISNNGHIGLIDVGSLSGNLNGTLLQNRGTIGTLQYGGSSVTSATYTTAFTFLYNDTGVIDNIINSQSSFCEPYSLPVFINQSIIYDWIDNFTFSAAAGTICVSSNTSATIESLTATITDYTTTGVNGFYNAGIIKDLILTIDTSQSVSSSYATIFNAASTGYIYKANINVNFGATANLIVLANSGIVYELTMPVYSTAAGYILYQDTGVIYVWNVDLNNITTITISTGVVYNIINPSFTIDPTTAKLGTLMVYKADELPVGVKEKYIGTATATSMPPFPVGTSNIGPYKIGASNIGPFKVV